MSNFLLEKDHIRKSCFLLRFEEIVYFNYQMLLEANSGSVLSETTCEDWFCWFKDCNFDLSDKKRENWPRKVEDYQF